MIDPKKIHKRNLLFDKVYPIPITLYQWLNYKRYDNSNIRITISHLFFLNQGKTSFIKLDVWYPVI